MTPPQQPPALNIPPSNSTVQVSIIDTTCHIKLPASHFLQPPVAGFTHLDACCYSFLIKHSNPDQNSKHDTLIFDLGVRKDWENGPTALIEGIKAVPSAKVEVEKDVATILRENGQPLENVGAIIWSHWHFDHTGDPATFPPSTDLIVGPGFKDAFVPAFPTVPDSSVDERSWQNRELLEMDFKSSSKEKKTLQIGNFNAIDFYGDGSFYLLDTPGHAVGHLCALARTTADPPTFMFLGGDIAHHGGEFRPTQYLPLPESISPDPLSAPFTDATTSCPGELFLAIHPAKSRTEPFFHPAGGVHNDVEEAKRSIRKLTEFDAYDEVFSVIAHDKSLFDVVEFYPKDANGWKAKDWGKEGRWRFLRSYETEGEESKEGERTG